MTTKVTAKHDLPKGITTADLQPPKWDTPGMRDIGYDDREFELWFTTGFGWCIPTLRIGSSGYRSGRGAQQRTYAVTVDGGKVARIGSGPHVLETLRVYNRPSRREAMQPFFDLRTKGAAEAGQVRDRISSRRAQGQIERASGRHSWRWDV